MYSVSATLFQPQVITHYSYHKCLTALYSGVMSTLANRHGFFYQHFNSRLDLFLEAIAEAQSPGVYSLNNKSEIPFDSLPDFKGSHFVRDPRDMLVSGYNYHLWTHEHYFSGQAFDWDPITSHPCFPGYVEADTNKFPRDCSYQEYLNLLDPERGMIVEMIWRSDSFGQMAIWNFGDPRIIEVRYEDFIGNEVGVFRDILNHYGMRPELIEEGGELVDQRSLRNLEKGAQKHTRSGIVGQWTEEFTPLVRSVFKELYGDLLIRLGYEKSDAW